MQTQAGGKAGENFAAKKLEELGYRIIARNFRSRFGEIDIVAVARDTLVFVEVKTRWSSKFGSPVEAVTPKKIANIEKTGQYFSLLNSNLPKKQRIEVFAIEAEKGRILSYKIINTHL